ncbi:MAG: NHL repeat-containing protein [archaeon]
MHLKKRVILPTAIALLLLIIAIILLIPKTTQEPPALSPQQWIAFNLGNPIIGEEQPPKIETEVIDDTIYLIYSDNEKNMFSSRLRKDGFFWETYTKDGWSSDQEKLAKRISLTEALYDIKIKSFNDGSELIGAYRGASKSLSTILDVHGASLSLKLKDENFSLYTEDKVYEQDEEPRTVLKNWRGSFNDLATNGEDIAIMVSSYACSLGCPYKQRITALRYDESDASPQWKLWNNGEWVTQYDNENLYVEVPFNGTDPSVQHDYPKIEYRTSDDDYVMIHVETNNLCASNYNDNEFSWKWWNGTNWTNEGEYSCFDLTEGDGNTAYLREAKLLTTNEGDIMIITLTGDNSLRETTYVKSENRWITNNFEHLVTQKYAIKETPSAIWLVFAVKNKVYLIEKKSETWVEKRLLFETGSENTTIEALEFIDGKPVIITLENGSIMGYSTAQLNGLATVQPPQGVIPLETGQMSLSNKWINQMEDSSYGPIISGHLAYDNDSILFSPGQVVAKVLIHYEETDDQTDGYFWGGFWDYFSFPIGLDIDNKRGKVYVADRTTGGGAGSIYSGRVSVYNLSYKNQNLWYQSYSGKPPGVAPPRIYPQSITNSYRFISDVAVDEERGLLYISDGGHHRIYQYNITTPDSGFSLIRVIGEKGSGTEQLLFPQGIDVDNSTGDVFVADGGNGRIQKIDSSGNFILEFGILGTSEGQLEVPFGLTVDQNREIIYITDPGSKKISAYTKEGDYIFSWNQWDEESPRMRIGGITANENGDVVVGTNEAYASHLERFSFNDYTDQNLNYLPDILETCHPTGCDQVCPLFCSELEDPDCGTSCSDMCRNGDEEETDCGGSCLLPEPETSCNDGLDNDKDCQTDCEDEDCQSEPHCDCADGYCTYGESCSGDCLTETICFDNVDNDQNGLTDCQDPDCDGELASINPFALCEYGEEISCTDEFDNNGNGLQDCSEENCDAIKKNCSEENIYGICYGEKVCSEEGWTNCDVLIPEPEICNDGIDNDCNGKTDLEDFGCWEHSCLLDFNGDGEIDLVDIDPLTAFADHEDCRYLNNSETDWCNFTDANRDGAVNSFDVDSFVASINNHCYCEFGPEPCDGYDNNCDGEIDEGCSCINMQNASCESQAGECENSTMICTTGE